MSSKDGVGLKNGKSIGMFSGVESERIDNYNQSPDSKNMNRINSVSPKKQNFIQTSKPEVKNQTTLKMGFT